MVKYHPNPRVSTMQQHSHSRFFPIDPVMVNLPYRSNSNQMTALYHSPQTHHCPLHPMYCPSHFHH